MIRFLATAAAFWVAARYIPGIHFTGSLITLLGVAFVFGVVNTIIAPIVKLLSLPFILLSLGFLLLVINASMLLLTSLLATRLELGFTVDGFVPAFWGSIVISLVSGILSAVFTTKKND